EADGEAVLRLAARGSRGEAGQRAARGTWSGGARAVAGEVGGSADQGTQGRRHARGAGGEGSGRGREAAAAQRLQGAAAGGGREACVAGRGRRVVKPEELCDFLRAKVSGAAHNDKRALFAMR